LYQVRQEKRDFAKAEQTIDSLSQQIEQTIGKPDEAKKNKSCSRPNLKYETGPLSCSVTFNLWYKNQGFENSNNLMEKISKNHAAKIRIGSGSSSGLSFVPKKETNGVQIFYQDIESINKLFCVIGYRYPTGLDQVEPDTNEEGFAVNISCGGPASHQFFPIQE
jgi:hypothetical protein